MNPPRILIVEDEPSMALGLTDNLSYEGYVVTVARDGREGWEYVQQNPYDLILLDLMLPHMSGYEVCQKLRGAGIETPVVFLSARGEEIDKVMGLELGADDYITKPFGLRELLARVKAVLRRSQGQAPEADENDSQAVTIGRLTIDFHQYTGRTDGQSVKLSAKEVDILRYMYEHANATVSREALLEEVWGYQEQPTTRTVDNFMRRLRQKVEADPDHPRLILTVHGMGYKLIYP